MIGPTYTRTQQTTRSRWVLVFLAALVAVLAFIDLAGTTSAAISDVAETSVQASAEPAVVPVGPPGYNTAGRRLGTFQIRDSLFSGPGGFLKFESTWHVTDDGVRLTTVIPMGGP